MSNLTRYELGGYDCGQTCIACGMEVSAEGEYVKFDDIKELLNSSHNTGSPKLPCFTDWSVFAASQGLSPAQAHGVHAWFARQLRASA